MTKARLIILFFLGLIKVYGQIPVARDTSFSVYSAYTKAAKQYPGISIVAEIHLKEIKEEKDIVYCDLNGRKLLTDAFYPADKNKINGIAIIIIHGGGWRSGKRAMHYPLAQRLATLGYTCFTPEYRLSTEAVFPAAVFDIKAAIKWVKQNKFTYNIDTSKTVLLGFSAGGELAAFVGTTADIKKFENSDCNKGFSSKVNALIDIDGTLSFTHPESSEGDDSKKLSAATQWLGVAKKDSLQLWQEASPLTHVNNQTPPVLFINSSIASMHAGRDDFIKVLGENKIYSEVHSFENSPHTFCLFNPWFQPVVEHIDDFLRNIFKK